MSEELKRIIEELPTVHKSKIESTVNHLGYGEIHSIDFAKSKKYPNGVEMTIWTGSYTASIYAVWDVDSSYLKNKYLR